MISSIKDLWDRFHLAQERHNTDAALCFRHAIEAATRADSISADWWRLEGEACESEAATSTESTETPLRARDQLSKLEIEKTNG